MNPTTHRTHLVLWAVFAGLLGVLSALLARQASVCLVGAGDQTMAELSPVTWWMFTSEAVLSFAAALGLAGLSRVRSNQAPCPHCGKPVEPRVTMAGELQLAAPPGPPAPPAP